jgi:hypothetical protein
MRRFESSRPSHPPQSPLRTFSPCENREYFRRRPCHPGLCRATQPEIRLSGKGKRRSLGPSSGCSIRQGDRLRTGAQHADEDRPARALAERHCQSPAVSKSLRSRPIMSPTRDGVPSSRMAVNRAALKSMLADTSNGWDIAPPCSKTAHSRPLRHLHMGCRPGPRRPPEQDVWLR